ncbi:group II intron maturase-specific domain-containing protein [Cerasicoccus maritimus]|uniref:group II intron maturase-specific domain-containing protein n=1 Tax=Cerasicoccus maritimus TaxID=490089 RepID=UPI00285255AD|nr:group II intron maturase-specific domain-containing protein [Cerasicoccus maritimus]
MQRFKTRIKDITARSRGGSMGQRLNELRQYAVGWFHYFKIGLAYAEALRLDQWMRRRVRLCFWKNWKWARTRRCRLIALGVDPERVKLASRSRKGLWRLSRNSLVCQALNDQHLKNQGVPSLRDLWVVFKYGEKAKT